MRHRAFMLIGTTPLVTCAFIVSTTALGIDWPRVTRHLELLDTNPAEAMHAVPPKTVVRGTTHPPRFTPDEISSGAYLTIKSESRVNQHCRRGSTAPLCADGAEKAGYGDHEVPSLIVGTSRGLVKKLDDMASRGLETASIPDQPWSDHYWPIHDGILGHRYADDSLPSGSWRERRDYATAHPAATVVQEGDKDAIDALSPAEKYDLLLGDGSGTLTEWGWKEGQYYAERNNGRVESWMGICHGWAPAALMMPRPLNAVSLKITDVPHPVTFYPSDIKALASLLWANAEIDHRFAGTRCDKMNPREDIHGRVLDPGCFDINPGAFHMTLVNQIGVHQRSLIIDANRDYEVWNQPVISYEYGYFNPSSRKNGSLAKSTIALAKWPRDKFKKHRDPRAESVVGVAMELRYVAETSPSHDAPDSPDADSVVSVTYTYDLELDAKGTIIGGEWYTNVHPDFLWTPPEDARAESDHEPSDTWTSDTPPPAAWKTNARSASKNGMPLAAIIESLIERSRQ